MYGSIITNSKAAYGDNLVLKATSFKGEIAYVPCLFNKDNHVLQMVKRLLENGCEVNGQGADGMTSLAIASFWGYTDIVNTLLKNG